MQLLPIWRWVLRSLLIGMVAMTSDERNPTLVPQDRRILPAPKHRGTMSLEETLATRRSQRTFRSDSLTIDQVSQLLWAAAGITSPDGYRTAPSAGALYPLELYLVTAAGVEHYDPADHALNRISSRDLRASLGQAALDQAAIRQAPAVFVFAAVTRRTAAKYRDRATRYVQIEVGHAAQNLLLQVVTLKLGAVPIGAFDDSAVRRVLALPSDQEPLYLIPVGRPR